MATIPEPSLFRWDCVDQLGDLERLPLMLDAIPDEPLMQLLERQRRNLIGVPHTPISVADLRVEARLLLQQGGRVPAACRLIYPFAQQSRNHCSAISSARVRA